MKGFTISVCVRCDFGLIQFWIGVPPTADTSRPTGCFSSRCRCRPKKYAVALKLARFSGVVSFHSPRGFTLLAPAPPDDSTNMRSCGAFAVVCSSLKERSLPSGHAMFDCPEHSHTSPVSTSWIVIVLLPFTVIVVLSPDFSGSSFTRHSPFSSAFADFVWPAMETVTSSPGEAHPQTGAAVSAWRIM